MGGALSNARNFVHAAAQAYPPTPDWLPDEMPDLTGHVVIVTGAGGNAGIGYETCKSLLAHNARVYLATRSRFKAEGAIASLKAATGREAVFLELDLASLVSVRRAADEFMWKERELHVLFNNAGVMCTPVEMLTKEGYDLQWGTNVVGSFFFTELLMPALLAGVKTSADGHARVITTSSSTAYLGRIRGETFRDSRKRRRTSRDALYAQSKLGNVIVARQVAKRYGAEGIVSIALNPGNIQSDLLRHMSPLRQKIMDFFIPFYPAPYGAITQLYAGTMPEPLEHNGEFMIPWARRGKCRKEAYDEDLGDRLWAWLQEEVRPYRQATAPTASVLGHWQAHMSMILP
ncbi:NAD(P)-binding protein [Epithele typhae]|uniref:NAD(P)-binding protein n=1 Tax=Epithele typhae TaxID=378194 RepID=UPI002008A04E|nr:NAD(P)-binding protein [Epithele typhae]KAH9932808.1 NAD(P)-binding protein [Epithele typhae]